METSEIKAVLGAVAGMGFIILMVLLDFIGVASLCEVEELCHYDTIFMMLGGFICGFVGWLVSGIILEY